MFVFHTRHPSQRTVVRVLRYHPRNCYPIVWLISERSLILVQSSFRWTRSDRRPGELSRRWYDWRIIALCRWHRLNEWYKDIVKKQFVRIIEHLAQSSWPWRGHRDIILLKKSNAIFCRNVKENDNGWGRLHFSDIAIWHNSTENRASSSTRIRTGEERSCI
jgi:hypothetical protein